MHTSIQQKLTKQYTALQYQSKIFHNIQKQLSLQNSSNIQKYIDNIQHTANISQSIYQNYLQQLNKEQELELFKLQNNIIRDLSTNLSRLNKKILAAASTQKKTSSNGYCQFCGDNMQQNKIKRVKMDLQQDYKQQFHLVLEQLKRLSNQNIFSEDQNKQFQELLFSQLNQREKVLKINDKKMEQFIDIMNNSLVELKKMKDNIFPQENQQTNHKQIQYSSVSHLNQHVSTFLQTSFQKKIPPWIHKMFERIMHMYIQSINAKKRDNGIQVNLDDPELRMARAQNRQLHRGNKELKKQLNELKEDYKNLQNIKTQAGRNLGESSRENLQLLLSINLNKKISPRNSSRQNINQKSKRSQQKSSRMSHSVRDTKENKISKEDENLTQQDLMNYMLANNVLKKKTKPNRNFKTLPKRNNQSLVSYHTNNNNSQKDMIGFHLPDIYKNNDGQNGHNTVDEILNSSDNRTLDPNTRIKQYTVRTDTDRIRQEQADMQAYIKNEKNIEKKPIDKQKKQNRTSKNKTDKLIKQKQRTSKKLHHKNSSILRSKDNSLLNNNNQQSINSKFSNTAINKNPQIILKKSIIKKNYDTQNKLTYNPITDKPFNDATIMHIRSSQKSDENFGKNQANKQNSIYSEKVRKVSKDLAENIQKKLGQIHINAIRNSNETDKNRQSQNSRLSKIQSIHGFQNCYFDSDGAFNSATQDIPQQIQNEKYNINDHQNHKENKKYYYRPQFKKIESIDKTKKYHQRQNNSLKQAPEKQTYVMEQLSQTLTNFSRKVYHTMKKHQLLPDVLKVQQFQTIIRQGQAQGQNLIPFYERYHNNKMSTIHQKSYSIQEQPVEVLSNKNEKLALNQLKFDKNNYSLSHKSVRFEKHYYSLFYNKKNAYKYEQNLRKCYHRRLNHILNKQEKQFCLFFFQKLSNLRQYNRQQYNKLCSVIRYPYDSLYNDFQIINFMTQMKYETFEYYFQKIIHIHRNCQKIDNKICEHIKEFTDKIGQN